MRRRPIVIAHRGASGYLPEHTLPAKALAHGMGADFLEQDVVASRDDQLIVCHDLYLDRVTDVAVRFPGRARADGLHYCRDFSLAELRTLRVTERRREDGSPRFPGRFPAQTGWFRLHTLEEELDLLQGLNHSTDRQVGAYVEVKEPAWHLVEGFDLGRRVVEVLADFGYRTDGDRFYLQCFSGAELDRLRGAGASEVPMIQLLDTHEHPDGAELWSIRRRAIGVGIPVQSLLEASSRLCTDAHDAGLQVHAYTLRADEVPAGVQSLGELLTRLVEQLGVDGLFTDFPDLVTRLLQEHAQI